MNVPAFPAIGGTSWRAERPFLGAVLLMLAGLIIGYVPIRFTLELILLGGAFTAVGLVFAVLIFLTGLLALLRPDLSTILGIAGVAFSILSVVGSLGGLLVGLLIGITGGNLLIAWYPPASQRDSGAQTTDTATMETSSGMGFSWQEDTITRGTDTSAPTTIPSSPTTTTDTGESKEGSEQFVWQADPYARQTTMNTEDVGTSVKGDPTTEPHEKEHGDEDDDRQVSGVEDGGEPQNSGFLLSAAELGSEQPSNTEPAERGDGASSTYHVAIDHFGDVTSVNSEVDARLEDALERVAYGATVSFPSILLMKVVNFAITTILTNGFAASLYGLYVLADKLLLYLRRSMFGFLPGLNRFLPNASPTEQDIFATLASCLMLGLGTVFGAGLFIIAPRITQAVDYGHQFTLFIRIFAVGLPWTLWIETANKLLEGLEEVKLLNLLFRVGFPIAQLSVAGIGTFLFHDLIVVAVGEVLITALITLFLTGWMMRNRGFTPRVRGAAAAQIRHRYVKFSIPLVFRQIVQNIQGAGFYLFIIVFLSSVAGGVFAVGTLVGSLVRLPLVLNNQFMSPVVADLHERDHLDTLIRLYQVTTRLILVGITGLAIPLLVYRGSVMHLFGPTFVKYTPLLPGFILAQYVASVAGSNGIILTMTDHQRATLVIEIATALFVVTTALPLTMLFGIRGLVISYFLESTMSNGLQIIVLYHLEGYHPFTRLHAKPLLAAVPFLLTALAGKLVLSAAMAPLVGTLAGLAAYGTTLHVLGFTMTERRLARSVLGHYWGTFPISR